MAGHRIFTMAFSSVYPLYVQKAERKGRSQNEVDQVIRWLTGYDQAGLEAKIRQNSDFETFFAQAPAIHPNAALIKGVVCGVRVEDVEIRKADLEDVFLNVMAQAAGQGGEGRP